MIHSNHASVALVILTWNAEKYIKPLFKSISEQSLAPDHILVIDSSSTDNTVPLLLSYHVTPHVIPKHSFDHGGTRKLATELVQADYYLFMTQDALPANPATFQNLIQTLKEHPQAGCAYGRQLPYPTASPLSRHLRSFNYPKHNQMKAYENKTSWGIKTCFNSDSFSAYKKTALDSIDGFPASLSFGEDIYVAAKMLLKGWKICYAANAEVIHSHDFTLKKEFTRYCSIGTFHRQESWIVRAFATPSREGIKYIYSEIAYLVRSGNFLWIPRACASWITKFLGYQLGYRGYLSK